MSWAQRFYTENVAALQSSATTCDSIWQQGPDTHREGFLPVLKATSELKIQNKINYPAPRGSRWGQEGWESVLEGLRQPPVGSQALRKVSPGYFLLWLHCCFPENPQFHFLLPPAQAWVLSHWFKWLLCFCTF